MMKLPLALLKALGFVFLISAVIYACSKGGDTPPTPSPCAGVTISVTATVTDAATGTNNGSIVASSSGGSGAMTYSLNGGAFQSSGTFNGLAKGNHTITAKDNKGCTGSKSVTVNETNACAGVTITLSAISSNSDPCSPSGVITATATGSTGFTYSLGAGTFQASNIFNNVSTGTHTINAKDAAGCSTNIQVTIGSLPAGPLFTAVRGVIQNNCAIPDCHSGPNPTGGINFTVDCNIVLNKDRIKARAVDGSPSIMPPTGALPQSEKNKITNWINAGGKFTD